MRIAALGLGYVGATSMACLAKLGHTVIGVDASLEKVAMVAAGESPILEPQVAELLAKAHAGWAANTSICRRISAFAKSFRAEVPCLCR